MLHDIAAGLGSDINFFLTGTPALCRGRGEQVESIPSQCAGWVLLVNPGFEISTAWTYRAWSEQDRASSQLTQPAQAVSVLRQALVQGDLQSLGAALYNSLEAPALWKFPILELIKERLIDLGATGALMSGSGATVFGLFADSEAANAAATDMRDTFGPTIWTQVTQMQCGSEDHR